MKERLGSPDMFFAFLPLLVLLALIIILSENLNNPDKKRSNIKIKEKKLKKKERKLKKLEKKLKHH